MKIDKTTNGAEMTVALEGRLDTVTAPALEAALGDLDGVTALVIDMEKVVYMSSAGLRALLKTQKALTKGGGGMVIRKVGRDIREIFEVTGFDELLTIED